MIPDRKIIKENLIELLKEKGVITPTFAYKELAHSFSLNEYDLSRKTNDKKEQFFNKEVRWARKDLVEQGYIKCQADSGRGKWELAENISKFEHKFLNIGETTSVIALSGITKDKKNSKPKGQKKPDQKTITSIVYVRDDEIVDYILTQAAGVCECCGKDSPFSKNDGEPYLEVHHVKRISDLGSDTIENTIAACPNCHRELHYGKNKELLKRSLYSKVTRLVPE